MPTKSFTPPAAPSADREARSATTARKTAATVVRRKQERRAESLRQIQEQTADGTLVIRYMTAEQQLAATEDAGQTRQRNDARSRRYRAAGRGST